MPTRRLIPWRNLQIPSQAQRPGLQMPEGTEASPCPGPADPHCRPGARAVLGTLLTCLMGPKMELSSYPHLRGC